MWREGCYYVLLFFACSCFGWLMEVTLKFFQFHRFINRGFLIGPYCPIYGVGSVLLAAVLPLCTDSLPSIFVMAMLLCGILEYFTSWAMERLFHARWWDYSQRPFNLNGRVWLGNLLAFGVLGVLVVKVVKPAAFLWFSRIPDRVAVGLCAGLSAVFSADVAVSANVLGHIRSVANAAAGDSTEAITRFVRETLLARSALARRALHAFPEARLYNRALLDRLKQARQDLTREVKARNRRFREDLEQRESRLRAEWKERKKN